MALIKEYTGIIYFLISSLTLFYYGFKNRGVQKVRAEFLDNKIRFSLAFFVSFLAPISYSIEVGLSTLVFGLISFTILMGLMYFDAFRYSIGSVDSNRINSTIKDLQNNEDFTHFFEKHSRYDIFCEPNKGLGGGYTIKIKTGYDVSLANKIKLGMADDLSELDDTVVNSILYYILAGLVGAIVLFIILR